MRRLSDIVHQLKQRNLRPNRRRKRLGCDSHYIRNVYYKQVNIIKIKNFPKNLTSRFPDLKNFCLILKIYLDNNKNKIIIKTSKTQKTLTWLLFFSNIYNIFFLLIIVLLLFFFFFTKTKQWTFTKISISIFSIGRSTSCQKWKF